MKKTALHVWNNCLSFIQDNIPEQAYKTWFLPIEPIKLQHNILTIQVPSKFFYEWLEEHYINLLKTILNKELGKKAKLIYSISMNRSVGKTDNFSLKIPSTQKQRLRAQEVDAPLVLETNKVRNPFIIPGLQKLKIDPQLNANYNFASFMEGECNRLARNAGIAIANNPGGTAFNPLFIYGSVGLGKTHLTHAIGVEVKELHPEKTVLYVSAEKFIQQFIDAVKNNTRNDFVHFYQMIDLLIVDDVHFLSGKRATQDAFFHIFNHLHQKGKQLILTSDKAPIDIQDMEQRLISRFKWGLSADLQTPDLNLRISILKYKAQKDGIELSDDILQYIARKVSSNIRELEGALISIMAQSSLTKRDITIDLARRTLACLITDGKKEISIQFIQKTISEYFQVALNDIQSKTRKRDIVQARQLAMYFAKEFTSSSLAHIGNQIGKRDHATVLHACKTVRNLSETDKSFKRQVEELRVLLTNEV